MIDQDIYSMHLDKIIMPIFSCFGILLAVLFYSYRERKIMSYSFLMLMALWICLSMDFFVYLMLSISGANIDSIFFNTRDFFLISPDAIAEVMLMMNIMAYFQWNVMNSFKSGWNDIQKKRVALYTSIVSWVMLIIHIAAYVDIYYRNWY